MYFTSGQRGASTSKSSRKFSGAFEKKKERQQCPQQLHPVNKALDNYFKPKRDEYYCQRQRQYSTQKNVKKEDSKGKSKQSSTRFIKNKQTGNQKGIKQKLSKLPPITPKTLNSIKSPKNTKLTNYSKKHKKSQQDCLHNSLYISQVNQSSSNRTLTTSLSQRILENIDTIDELTKKYQNTIQQIQSKKCVQYLTLSSKYQSTKSKFVSSINKPTIILFKQILQLYDDLLLTSSIKTSCEIVYKTQLIPHCLLYFQMYYWSWISFVLMAKLRINQSCNLHIRNLLSYCRVNYYLQITNLLQQYQVESDVYQSLSLIQKKAMTLQKRQKQIEQNSIIIKSIVLMLIESNDLNEIQICLVNQKQPSGYSKQFFRIWRQQKLYPVLPPIKQILQITVCIDLDNILVYEQGQQYLLRPYSLQLIQDLPKQIQIILFSEMDGEQIQKIVKILLSSHKINEFDSFIPNFCLPEIQIQLQKLFNRQSSQILLLTSKQYKNAFYVTEWRGSQYDNELLNISNILQQKISLISI